jgi:hypothetical protein
MKTTELAEQAAIAAFAALITQWKGTKPPLKELAAEAWRGAAEFVKVWKQEKVREFSEG